MALWGSPDLTWLFDPANTPRGVATGGELRPTPGDERERAAALVVLRPHMARARQSCWLCSDDAAPTVCTTTAYATALGWVGSWQESKMKTCAGRARFSGRRAYLCPCADVPLCVYARMRCA
jgi:hypothetical protein